MEARAETSKLPPTKEREKIGPHRQCTKRAGAQEAPGLCPVKNKGHLVTVRAEESRRMACRRAVFWWRGVLWNMTAVERGMHSTEDRKCGMSRAVRGAGAL